MTFQEESEKETVEFEKFVRSKSKLTEEEENDTDTCNRNSYSSGD